MTSHKKLKEDEEAGEAAPIVVKKKRCNFWLWVAISQVIVFIFLILAICGVFDSVSDNSNESGAAGGMESLVLDEESGNGEIQDEDEVQSGDKYMTGDTAPNIIFLVANDIGYADISLHDGAFSTPNIDSILESGVEFTQFYSHHSSTPSRMALLTGRLAWKLGAQFPEELQGMMTGHIPFAEKTFAEVTKEMGYNNYYVGQWGAGYASWSMTPLGRGWDKFMGYFGSKNGYYSHTTDHFDEWLGVYDMWENQEVFVDDNMTYSEDLFLQKSFEFLDEARESGKPFTFTYASQTAHSPIDDDYPSLYPPTIWMECDPDQDNDALAGREYFCNKVKYLDYTWGLLIDHLKVHDMWDNTIIFIASDNGALPYAENLDTSDWGCNWPLRGGKYSNFEGGIRVWAGMSGGLIPEDVRGTAFQGLTHIVDFAATAMRLSMTSDQLNERTSLTGTDKSVDGKNLYYFEEHDLIVHTVPTQFLAEWMTANCSTWAATDGHWKYIVGSQCALYDSGWHNFPGQESVLMSSHPDLFNAGGSYCSDGCLFDLSTDQNEYLDVSEDYPVIAEYFKELTQAIWIGGFDEEYHSGQPGDEDYRGYQKDNVLRPYINEAAIADFVGRMQTVDYDFSYDYYSSPQFWIGDYDGENSPFGNEEDE